MSGSFGAPSLRLRRKHELADRLPGLLMDSGLLGVYGFYDFLVADHHLRNTTDETGDPRPKPQHTVEVLANPEGRFTYKHFGAWGFRFRLKCTLTDGVDGVPLHPETNPQKTEKYCNKKASKH